jgi:Mrp family chromosome partitioning ATPase
MTALDRAFIKAYGSRRGVRGSTADSSSAIGEVTLERGGLSYRIDAAHASGTARASGPHVKPTGRKPRRPSAETIDPAPPSPPVAIEQPARKERIVVSVSEAMVTTDWIWQREPHPVFANQPTTAEPVATSTSIKRPVLKPPTSKLLSPEVLSLSLLSPTSSAPNALPPTVSPPNVSPLIAAMPAPMPVTQPTAQPAPMPMAQPAPMPMAQSVPMPMAQPVAQPVILPPSAIAAQPPRPSVPAPAQVSGPLSSFALTAPIEDRLQPALEVDHFLWPAQCAALNEAAALALDGFATRLIEGAHCGQRRVALVGAAPGVGTTTVALCLARLAQAKESWWGLVDGDFAHASLARQLGIAQAGGWQAVLTGREKLADVSIASLDDRLILVPLSAEKLDSRDLSGNFRAPVLFSMLADATDLVLVDGGTAQGQQLGHLTALVRAARIDAVYVVYDERSTSPDALAACAERLGAAGVVVAGAIANFAAC